MSNENQQDADPELLTAFGSAMQAAHELGRGLTRQMRGEIPSMIDVSLGRAETHLHDALDFLAKARAKHSLPTVSAREEEAWDA